MQKIIFPGQAIATSEEAEPASGSVEEGGWVYASVVGALNLSSGKAVVSNPKTPRLLGKGDVVFGRVEDLFDQVALISFSPSQPGVVSSADRAFLRISEVQGRGKFTEGFRDFLRIGDLIKARVVEVTELGVYVSIAEKGFGVVKAYCGVCRRALDDNLECKNCLRRERRKMA